MPIQLCMLHSNVKDKVPTQARFNNSIKYKSSIFTFMISIEYLLKNALNSIHNRFKLDYLT